MNYLISKARKATLAALTAGIGLFVSSYPDGITTQEWSDIVGLALVTWYVTWQFPNTGVKNASTPDPSQGH